MKKYLVSICAAFAMLVMVSCGGNPAISAMEDFIANPTEATFNAVEEAEKGMTEEQARELLLKNYLYYGVMMVKMGDADGMVSGLKVKIKNVQNYFARFLFWLLLINFQDSRDPLLHVYRTPRGTTGAVHRVTCCYVLCRIWNQSAL